MGGGQECDVAVTPACTFYLYKHKSLEVATTFCGSLQFEYSFSSNRLAAIMSDSATNLPLFQIPQLFQILPPTCIDFILYIPQDFTVATGYIAKFR